jgi:hypothetical protein
MKWSSPRYSISVFCHCDHFMTKQTVTMSGDWSFHDKTDWYYVWGFTITWQNTWILYQGLTFSWQTDQYYVCGLTISWQIRLILCLGWSWNCLASDIVSIDFVMKWSSPRHSISVFCHEMIKPQTWYQSILSWNGQASDTVSVCVVMKWSSPRYSISVFCHEMVKTQT